MAIARFYGQLRGLIDEFDVEPTLRVLITATDTSGVAVSGFGMVDVLRVSMHGIVEPWIRRPHPILGEPKWPSVELGAMVTDDAPDWLVGVVDRADDRWRSSMGADVLDSCGIAL